MGNFFKEIAKSTVVGFVVGAAVALLLPALAGLAGVGAATLGNLTNPVFVGLFVAGMNGITTALTPLANKVFGGNQARIEDFSVEAPGKEIAGLEKQACCNKFQDAVAASRAQVGQEIRR